MKITEEQLNKYAKKYLNYKYRFANDEYTKLINGGVTSSPKDFAFLQLMFPRKTIPELIKEWVLIEDEAIDSFFLTYDWDIISYKNRYRYSQVLTSADLYFTKADAESANEKQNERKYEYTKKQLDYFSKELKKLWWLVN